MLNVVCNVSILKSLSKVMIKLEERQASPFSKAAVMSRSGVKSGCQGKGQPEVDAGRGSQDGCCRRDQKWMLEPEVNAQARIECPV